MKEKKGVTLIELIVSIVIFSLLIVGIAMFNSQNTRAAVRSERNAKRVLMKENVIEDFKGFLKSAPVAGERFDDVWVGGNVGDVLLTRTDPATGISVSLEIESFIPDKSAAVTQTGVYLEISVHATDAQLGIDEETTMLISRHD